MDVRCFYGRFVNGILDQVRSLITPELRARLVAAGLDPDARLEIYRAAAFFAAVPVLAEAVAPGAPPDEAEHRLGAAVVQGYLADEGTRAMAGYFAQLGTRATLVEAEAFFRTGDNFIQIRPTVVGERHIRLHLRGTGGHPDLFRGILEAAHHHCGEATLRAEITERDADAATFDVTW
jgi:uncharacterized protein (TIGR02265 family)